MNNKYWIVGLLCCICSCFFQTQAQVVRADTINLATAKTDVAKTKDSAKAKYKIIPRVATMRSLMVPGWGQIYNRQYWKLPLVYGGFGVNIYFIIMNNNNYQYFRKYYEEIYYQASGTTIEIIDFDGATRALSADQLKRRVDAYRRNRDGSYLILLVVWAANIIDANVTAHLKTFDLTDDISLKIQPSFSSPNIAEPVFGAKLTFTLK